MKIELDTERCVGHLRCQVTAPDMFDADELGNAVLLLTDGEVPAGREAAARLAVNNCPEHAISVEQ